MRSFEQARAVRRAVATSLLEMATYLDAGGRPPTLDDVPVLVAGLWLLNARNTATVCDVLHQLDYVPVHVHDATVQGFLRAHARSPARALSAAGPATIPEGGPGEVTALTSFGQFGRDAYLYAALEQGLFTAANLDVAIEPGGGTQPGLTALLGGQAQFILIDMAGAIAARNELDGYRALAAIHQQPPAALMAYTDSGITGPADLAGRTVALGAGTVVEMLWPAYAEQAGINVDTVEVVPLAPPELIPALASSRADAVEQFAMGRPTVQAAGGGRDVTVLDYGEYLPELYGVCLFTTAELAEQDPDLCARFRDALLAGLDYALDNPAQAAAALQAHVPESDPDVAAAELEIMDAYCRQVPPGQPLGHIDEARVMRAIALLLGIGAATVEMQPADLVAFDLTPGEA